MSNFSITESKEGNSTKKDIFEYIKKMFLQMILILMGVNIIAFNVVGHKELFTDPSIITPFGFLVNSGSVDLDVLCY